jgi:hypothetical protein
MKPKRKFTIFVVISLIWSKKKINRKDEVVILSMSITLTTIGRQRQQFLHEGGSSYVKVEVFMQR